MCGVLTRSMTSFQGFAKRIACTSCPSVVLADGAYRLSKPRYAHQLPATPKCCHRTPGPRINKCECRSAVLEAGLGGTLFLTTTTEAASV